MLNANLLREFIFENNWSINRNTDTITSIELFVKLKELMYENRASQPNEKPTDIN